MSVSQWEREAIGERTKEVLRHKIKNHERVGAVPFGFNLAEDGITLTPNETEREAISLINELRDGGLSLRKIAQELTERGYRTKSGGRTWRHSSVQRILARTPG